MPIAASEFEEFAKPGCVAPQPVGRDRKTESAARSSAKALSAMRAAFGGLVSSAGAPQPQGDSPRDENAPSTEQRPASSFAEETYSYVSVSESELHSTRTEGFKNNGPAGPSRLVETAEFFDYLAAIGGAS